MDALSRGGWMDTLSRSVSIYALSRDDRLRTGS